MKRFPNLSFAYEVIKIGGNLPCILNAANEIAVSLFLQEKIGFMDMSRLIEKTLQKASFLKSPSLDDYQQTDSETREIITELFKSHSFV